MAVFFVYSPDGGECSSSDMEYSPSVDNVKRQLADRVRTGKGQSYFLSDLPEISWRGAQEARAEDEWPKASKDAYMAVWRCRAGERPSGSPTEVWRYSGQIDKPDITRVEGKENA